MAANASLSPGCLAPLGISKKATMGNFVPVNGLHHIAYRCRDAEETRRFYEDLLGSGRRYGAGR